MNFAPRSRPARRVMVPGTTSGVEKSWLATALCPWYAGQGLQMAPLKAQNMSDNARVVKVLGICGNVLGLYLHGLLEQSAVLRPLFGAEAATLDSVVVGRHFTPGGLASLIDFNHEHLTACH